jgi:hypothetical protein
VIGFKNSDGVSLDYRQLHVTLVIIIRFISTAFDPYITADIMAKLLRRGWGKCGQACLSTRLDAETLVYTLWSI